MSSALSFIVVVLQDDYEKNTTVTVQPSKQASVEGKIESTAKTATHLNAQIRKRTKADIMIDCRNRLTDRMMGASMSVTIIAKASTRKTQKNTGISIKSTLDTALRKRVVQTNARGLSTNSQDAPPHASQIKRLPSTPPPPVPSP